MALPKIAAPTFELIQPSTGKKIQYRSFLVKEEKALLTARESGDKADIYRAIKQIINNCVLDETFDVNKIPLVDMEYIFIQLRSKSVDNIVKFQIEDSDDGKVYELEVDLNEIVVQYPEEKHDGIIKINDTVGIKMCYPYADIDEHIKDLETISEVLNTMVMECIEYVFDEENTYSWSNETDKEKNEFLDSLSVEVYAKMEEFLNTSPFIEHIVTYTNSEGTEKKIAFRNLNDFFTLD